LAVLLIAFAVVMALPADETVVGEFTDSDNFNPEDLQEFLKLKKFKKLFLKG
jgi:ABC-type sugar transport system permease subunit